MNFDFIKTVFDTHSAVSLSIHLETLLFFLPIPWLCWLILESPPWPATLHISAFTASYLSSESSQKLTAIDCTMYIYFLCTSLLWFLKWWTWYKNLLQFWNHGGQRANKLFLEQAWSLICPVPVVPPNPTQVKKRGLWSIGRGVYMFFIIPVWILWNGHIYK